MKWFDIFKRLMLNNNKKKNYTRNCCVIRFRALFSVFEINQSGQWPIVVTALFSGLSGPRFVRWPGSLSLLCLFSGKVLYSDITGLRFSSYLLERCCKTLSASLEGTMRISVRAIRKPVPSPLGYWTFPCFRGGFPILLVRYNVCSLCVSPCSCSIE